MSFITKDFISIVASIVNQMRGTQKKIDDFRTGAVARTITEAAAIEIDQLYQEMLSGLVDGIPVAVYLAFGFDLLAATVANGLVTFTIPVAVVDTTIPAGTQLKTTDGTKSYVTLDDCVILAGATTGNVDIQATGAGSGFNCGLGDITIIVAGAPVGTTVTNPAAITNGFDAETDDQRRIRFNRFIESLSRGPLGSIEYGATTGQLVDVNGVVTERVVSAQAVELYRIRPTAPLGYVNVYIFNGGSGASVDLVALVQNIVNGYIDGGGNKIIGYKCAGVRAVVAAATVETRAIDGRVTTNNGKLTAAQTAALDTALNAVIAQVDVSGTLYTDALSSAAKTVEGVISFTPLDPPNDYNPGFGIKLQPGVLTYTVVAEG